MPITVNKSVNEIVKSENCDSKDNSRNPTTSGKDLTKKLALERPDKVKVEFEYFKEPFHPVLYACTITSAVITEKSFIEEINGVHRPGKNNIDVEAIRFLDGRVEFFPRGLYNIFPNLKFLQIRNCGLKQITRKDLIGLEGLTTLSIYKNALVLLPSDLLINMRNLTRVSFGFNKLQLVHPNILKPMLHNKITLINFAGNATINLFYQQDQVGSVKSVEKLMERLHLDMLINSLELSNDGEKKMFPDVEFDDMPNYLRLLVDNKREHDRELAKLFENFRKQN